MYKFNLEEEKLKHPKLWDLVAFQPNGKKSPEYRRIGWFRRLVSPPLPPIRHRDSFYAPWEDIGKAAYKARNK